MRILAAAVLRYYDSPVLLYWFMYLTQQSVGDMFIAGFLPGIFRHVIVSIL